MMWTIAVFCLDIPASFPIFVQNCYGTSIMARPVTVTKERILSAALDLVRSGGPSALTARNLARIRHQSPPAAQSETVMSSGLAQACISFAATKILSHVRDCHFRCALCCCSYAFGKKYHRFL